MKIPVREIRTGICAGPVGWLAVLPHQFLLTPATGLLGFLQQVARGA